MKHEKKRNANDKAAGTPVRITMKSSRRETQARLFEAIFGDGDGSGYLDGGDLTRLSPAEELMMGILSEDDEAAASEEAENAADGDSEENMEFITEGLLTCQLDPDSGVKTYTITYAESELTGMEGSQSSILFRTDDPGLVHMVRTGTVSTALTFRAHCRALCTYNTPYYPFQLGIHSLLVDNRLQEEGRLTLEYIIEIRGAQAEQCRMDMQVTAQEPENKQTHADTAC